jgi:hypothetical protein
MEFVPAGEIIGAAHQVRTVGLRDSRQLPDGDYRFVDTYCADPSCDCRKTMILVFLNDVHVSTINFGWEPQSFYQEWMGSQDDRIRGEMSGASIDSTSPNGVPAKGMLAFFMALLDENWIARFRAHYAAVKRELSESEGKGKSDGSRTTASQPIAAKRGSG